MKVGARAFYGKRAQISWQGILGFGHAAFIVHDNIIICCDRKGIHMFIKLTVMRGGRGEAHGFRVLYHGKEWLVGGFDFRFGCGREVRKLA